MAEYPGLSDYQVRYVTANNGQGICSRVNLGGQRKINSITFALCGAYNGYSWSGAYCTGNGRDVQGAIWLNRPTAVMQAPDYRSSNVINTASKGRVSSGYNYNFSAVPGYSDSVFYFDGLVVDRDEIWVGIASTAWTTNNNYNDVVFGTNRSGSYDGYLTAFNYNWGWESMSSHWEQGAMTLAVVNMSIENPYTPPSIYLNTENYTKIGLVKNTSSVGAGKSYGVNYSYNTGSNTDMRISLAIQDYNNTSWNVRWEPDLRYVNGSSSSVWDYYDLGSDKGFTSGNRYRITLVGKSGEVLSPNSWNPQDGLVIYTYQVPTINTSLTINRTQQNANQDNSFTISGTNDRAWSSYENVFQTHYRMKVDNGSWGNWINLGNITNWSRTAAEMRSLVGKSNDGKTIYLEFKRYSPSANIYSDNTASGNFKVYYKPLVGVASNDITYKNSNNQPISKGQIINKNNLTDIIVSWNYDTTRATAGYTQGYRVRLMYGNTILKTYYTSNKNYTIPKNDITANGNTLSLDITPYYKNDSSDSNNYWYYDNPIKVDFVAVMSPLLTPVIQYPINNSNWINKDFRICLTLPEDPDVTSVPGIFYYDNIEFSINNQVYRLANTDGTTSGSILIDKAYTISCIPSNLYHQRPIIIYPNAMSIPDASSYTIKIRVKKPFNATADTNYGWSDWSSNIIIYKNNISFSVNTEDKINASHYNNMINIFDRMKTTYNMSNTTPAKVVANQSIITRQQYNKDSLYKIITDIKTKVNTYGPIVESQCYRVKFDYNDSINIPNTPSQEYVTAIEDGSGGVNAIKKFYTQANLLK